MSPSHLRTHSLSLSIYIYQLLKYTNSLSYLCTHYLSIYISLLYWSTQLSLSHVSFHLSHVIVSSLWRSRSHTIAVATVSPWVATNSKLTAINYVKRILFYSLFFFFFTTINILSTNFLQNRRAKSWFNASAMMQARRRSRPLQGRTSNWSASPPALIHPPSWSGSWATRRLHRDTARRTSGPLRTPEPGSHCPDWCFRSAETTTEQRSGVRLNIRHLKSKWPWTPNPSWSFTVSWLTILFGIIAYRLSHSSFLTIRFQWLPIRRKCLNFDTMCLFIICISLHRYLVIVEKTQFKTAFIIPIRSPSREDWQDRVGQPWRPEGRRHTEVHRGQQSPGNYHLEEGGAQGGVQPGQGDRL